MHDSRFRKEEAPGGVSGKRGRKYFPSTELSLSPFEEKKKKKRYVQSFERTEEGAISSQRRDGRKALAPQRRKREKGRSHTGQRGKGENARSPGGRAGPGEKKEKKGHLFHR